MICAGIADQHRPLCYSVACRSVSWTLFHVVLIVKTATGTVTFNDLVTHSNPKFVTAVEDKDWRDVVITKGGNFIWLGNGQFAVLSV